MFADRGIMTCGSRFQGMLDPAVGGMHAIAAKGWRQQPDLAAREPRRFRDGEVGSDRGGLGMVRRGKTGMSGAHR